MKCRIDLISKITSWNRNKRNFFLLNVFLKVFMFLKVWDSDQVELEAMVLDSPKFYNHEYCSLVVIFHSSPN